jgi:hypothetical protein
MKMAGSGLASPCSQERVKASNLGHTPGELLRTYAHMIPGDHDRAHSAVQAALERDVACHARVTEGPP